jgi:hypothetical protein
VKHIEGYFARPAEDRVLFEPVVLE